MKESSMILTALNVPGNCKNTKFWKSALKMFVHKHLYNTPR